MFKYYSTSLLSLSRFLSLIKSHCKELVIGFYSSTSSYTAPCSENSKFLHFIKCHCVKQSSLLQLIKKSFWRSPLKTACFSTSSRGIVKNSPQVPIVHPGSSWKVFVCFYGSPKVYPKSHWCSTGVNRNLHLVKAHCEGAFIGSYSSSKVILKLSLIHI